jgi:hypothetical protein
MGYGLKVQSFDSGGNTITQIDTELGLTNFVITSYGRGSQVNIGHTPGKVRFIFIKPLLNSSGVYSWGTPSSTYIGDGDICVEGQFSTTTTIKFFQSYREGGEGGEVPDPNAYLGAIVDYIIVEDVTTVEPVGEYGLQTLTAGNEVSFDSRRIIVNKTIDITSVIPAGSVGGYGGGTYDLLTSDTNTYVCVSPWSYWSDPGNKAGLVMQRNGTNLYHLDVDGDYDYDEPQYQGPMFYDNYTAILLAKLI